MNKIKYKYPLLNRRVFFMKKILIIFIIIVILVITFNTVNAEVLLIPDEAIRMRVIPNSNDEADITIKNKVKNQLQTEMVYLLKDATSINESRQIINNNLKKIDAEISSLLKKENYNLGYNLNYSLNYFPEKTYKGVKYKEGYYESVLVTLGEGKGDNWWCVLFPPLCLIEADETTSKNDVEYKFFIKEIIDKFF